MADPKDPLVIAAERLAVNMVLLHNKLDAAALVCFSLVPPIAPSAFTRMALAAYLDMQRSYEKHRDDFMERWKAKNEPEPSPQSDPKGVE